MFSSIESVLVVSLLLTPVISGLLVTLLKRKRIIEVTTVVSSFLILIQGLFLLSSILEKKSISLFDGIFYLDSLSAIMIITISLVGFLSSLYSVNYMGIQYDKLIVDRQKLVRYYQGFNMFLFTMLLVPISNNLGIMWIAIEATTLVSVLLIMLYTKQGSIEASWKYLLISTVGLSLALFGIILFYYANSVYDNSFNSIHGMDWTNMVENALQFDPNLVKFAFIFILVGFGTKAGLAPMHTWLPDAHSEAPSPISALLSGVLLNCAFYGLLRFHIISSHSIGSGFSNTLLIILGIISLGIAAASIYFQKDVKRMLAFSSVEHMGIISVSMGFGVFLGIYGALLHVINHAVVKSLLFFSSGSISQKYQTKSITDTSGIIKTMPITGFMFLIGGLAIIGMPPFNIFMSEFLMLSSGFSSENFLASALVILFLVIIFASFGKHLLHMVFGNPKSEMEKGDFGKLSILPMVILGSVIFIMGIYVPEPLQTLIEDASKIILVGGANS
ncbi:membrane-bound [NiFe]-hydrogenase-4, subunit F-like protein [Nitrosarchaeum koreense MY1]|uniref:Membrane-bound [NiFe]-hydrogenase-4, subunit F-like protein n=2 Tax=Nitrosarchaeum TaxID=1007082 RepID=F9CW30_9ARCH|nr:membrane-bound [NiFe]-hydrogenase-4, subunit F-like protein [Nitrosarchaeum koreense MY1]